MEINLKNLEFGDMRVFQLLSDCKHDDLGVTYSSILDVLLNSIFWSEKQINAPRVHWQKGKNIRNVKKDVFSKAGLYLWGAGNIPRYIGMTNQSFNKRFNRYIWGKKSQCNLAIWNLPQPVYKVKQLSLNKIH